MGCDYYIVKVLHIYYNDYDYLDIEFERDKRYYMCQYDEDEEDYEEKVSDYVKRTLTPEMNPILIYNNNSFQKLSYETKYKILIENEIKKYCKKWSDIVKIVKVEERHENTL